MHRPTSRLLPLVAPALLVLVALGQMTLVHTHRLTPWKGGGFGMFSTLDGPSLRTFRLVLLTAEDEALVAIPDLTVEQQRLLNFPNEALLRDVAAQAARTSWRVHAPEQVWAARRSLPAEIRRQIHRAGEAPALAFARTSARGRPTGRTPRLVGVRAEVWRLEYAPDPGALRGEIVTSVTVPAEARP